VMRLADGAIEWQLVISPAFGVASGCCTHCTVQTEDAAWVTSRASKSAAMVAGRRRRARDCDMRVTTGSGYAFQKRWRGFARLFRPTYAPRHAGAGGANLGHPSRFLWAWLGSYWGFGQWYPTSREKRARCGHPALSACEEF
jgi:hypothetical protein